MFDNLTLIAIIVILFWLGIFAYYMITSRQQQELQKDMEELQEMLDDDQPNDQ